jgi:hypothetical protein
VDARHPRGSLVNNGLPLLDTPQTSVDGAAAAIAAAATAMAFHTPLSSTTEHEKVRVRAPRHDFPKFQGATPTLWIDQCLTYFERFKIPHHQWVSLSSL